MHHIYSLFLELPSAVSSTEFKAIPLSANRKDYLARSDDGAPVFLLHDSSAPKYNPDINFRYLSAQFHATCSVQTDDGDLQDQFCLVSCDAAVPELHELFIRCVGAAIEELPESSGTRELESCILQMRDLFRALALPSSREVSGLWAELFVISRCGDPTLALSLWHEDQFDRFDFSSESMRLEVKSSVRGLRAHEFSLEQLHPPTDGFGFVTSILLQPLTGGIGVLELAKNIEVSIGKVPRLKKKLWENVARTLGVDFSDQLDKRFDPTFTEKSLAVFSMGDIPRPSTTSDPRITAIRFVADLSSVSSSLPNSALSALTQIFADAIPDK